MKYRNPLKLDQLLEILKDNFRSLIIQKMK